MNSFLDDLKIDPSHIEKQLRDLAQRFSESEVEKEEIQNKLKSAERRIGELENEVRSFQNQFKEEERALQASERAKEHMEVQFDRTKETISLLVSFCLLMKKLFTRFHKERLHIYDGTLL